MYDEIDDIDLDVQTPARSVKRLWLGFAILAGLTALAAAAVFTNKAPDPGKLDQAALEQEQSAYRAALTDVSPAMRRARLTDFLNTYPDSKRQLAVRTQLQVIAEAEGRDWAALSHIVFDTEQDAAAKLQALEEYETVWDAALLGGREADVARIRARIEESLSQKDMPLPDRDLPIDPDSVPENVPGDALLGGARKPRRGYAVKPRPPVIQPQFEPEVQTDVITAPRVRRNRRPKYPRRAMQRGAEAIIILDLFVDERGRVQTTELISADADDYEKDFIRAAESAAMRTRFHPQLVNGMPVPSQSVEKIYRFEMRE